MSKDSPFNRCDVYIEHGPNAPVAKLIILANKKGQGAFDAYLFPGLPITWYPPKPEFETPPGWGWAILDLQKMTELCPDHKLGVVQFTDPENLSMDIYAYRLVVSLGDIGVGVITADDKGLRVWNEPFSMH